MTDLIRIEDRLKTLVDGILSHQNEFLTSEDKHVFEIIKASIDYTDPLKQLTIDYRSRWGRIKFRLCACDTVPGFSIYSLYNDPYCDNKEPDEEDLIAEFKTDVGILGI